MALIVLDEHRAIKMANGAAEGILGIASHSTGHLLERYLPPSSKQTLTLALDEASQDFAISTARLSTPLATKVEILSEEGQNTNRWADLSISAWYRSQSPLQTSSDGRDTERPPTRRAHDACFTIAISLSTQPPDEGEVKSSETKQQSRVVDEFILHRLDLAFLAVDKEGKHVGRNKAASEVWSVLKPGQDSSLDKVGLIEDERDLGWAQEVAIFYDENFEKVLSLDDLPLYKCAILGQEVAPVLLGAETKLTKERFIFEIIGHPVRDKGGEGEHIGGVVTFRNVTAEKEKLKQEAEEQANLYFRKTLNALPLLVYVTSPEGDNPWYSDAYYKFIGVARDDPASQDWVQYVHPEDVPHAAGRWMKALELGQMFEAVLRFRRHDGEWRWHLGRALPVRDSLTSTDKITKWFCTTTEINDHVEALSLSRRSQSQLESVIYHANVTIWAVDKEGIITLTKGPGVKQLKLNTPSPPSAAEAEEDPQDANASFHTKTDSHARKTLVGKSIYDVWDMCDIRQSMKRALEGETAEEEMQIDGRWFRTSYTPMRRGHLDEFNPFLENQGIDVGLEQDSKEGEIIGVVGASLDITDRKEAQFQMEKSLIDKTSALAAEEAAREASRLKSEFLANMSHEIRTPIAGVIGLAELLLEEKGLTEQLREYAETIQSSAEGLLTVINDVLDFSKVEIGKLEVEKAPFNLHVPLTDAKRMFSFATQKKGLDFKQSLDLKYKGMLIGDAGRLKQVLTNLLTNAIKFTSRGYVSLEVTELEEKVDTLKVRFDVRDTGCGINAETLSKLFQPFSQADSSTARRFGGTGLGLSISKKLVKLMNGEIGLESVENQGSHAWFIIPFAKAAAIVRTKDARPSISRMASTRIIDGNSPARHRGDIWILIAEDNAVNARIASKYVEMMGFKYHVAENGRLALEELNKRRYDVVLMDCQMPECDGYQATRIIRQSNKADIRILPIIALTASAIKGDRERALDAGMVDYLSKPVKRSALEATLCKWLFNNEARQHLAKYLDDAPLPVEDGIKV